MKDKKQLWLETRRLLRRHGLDSLGRPRKKVDRNQEEFERRMVLTPTGGQSVRHP